MKQELKTLKSEPDDLAEIADEIDVVVGPGRMLKEAREMRGLSEQQVADKLNFRTRLVRNIEVDIFNRDLPEAFNRGYLKNYAKLVNISEGAVLNSYDQLAQAQSQCAGMQSFSKGTEKQAEHNMLMWITYFILAMLVTATVVWWFQSPLEQPAPIVVDTTEMSAGENNTTEQANLSNKNSLKNLNTEPKAESEDSLASVIKNEENANVDNIDKAATLDAENISSSRDLSNAQVTLTNDNTVDENALFALNADVVFTFSGDCWVNIFDATGERIAWGVKKSGYIMRISGQAPFSITLGKPELVEIGYNDLPVDMTVFNVGNIAKFSLPLVP
jgi:cytoskeleton protein RodZ